MGSKCEDSPWKFNREIKMTGLVRGARLSTIAPQFECVVWKGSFLHIRTARRHKGFTYEFSGRNSS